MLDVRIGKVNVREIIRGVIGSRTCALHAEPAHVRYTHKTALFSEEPSIQAK